jgi:hypothetical protein
MRVWRFALGVRRLGFGVGVEREGGKGEWVNRRNGEWAIVVPTGFEEEDDDDGGRAWVGVV